MSLGIDNVKWDDRTTGIIGRDKENRTNKSLERTPKFALFFVDLYRLIIHDAFQRCFLRLDGFGFWRC